MDHAVVDLSGYTWRWFLNVGLGVLLFLSAVQNVVVAMNITGAWLGVSDVVWHRVLLVLALATVANTLFNRTPVVTQPPTQMRLAVENQVHEIRKTA